MQNGTVKPIYYAVSSANKTLVELLLKNGADLNLSVQGAGKPVPVVNMQGKLQIQKPCSLLHMALCSRALHPHPNMVVTDISCNPGLDASCDPVGCVRALLGYGVDVNITGNEPNNPPLHSVIRNGFSNTVALFEMMLAIGADVQSCAQGGM